MRSPRLLLRPRKPAVIDPTVQAACRADASTWADSRPRTPSSPDGSSVYTGRAKRLLRPRRNRRKLGGSSFTWSQTTGHVFCSSPCFCSLLWAQNQKLEGRRGGGCHQLGPTQRRCPGIYKEAKLARVGAVQVRRVRRAHQSRDSNSPADVGGLCSAGFGAGTCSSPTRRLEVCPLQA